MLATANLYRLPAFDRSPPRRRGTAGSTPGTVARPPAARSAASSARIGGRPEEPQVAAHQPVGPAEPPLDDELAAQDRHDPAPSAEALGAVLVAVAEVRELAAQLEERLASVEHVEHAAVGHVSTFWLTPHQQRAFQRLDAVLVEARHVELHDRRRAGRRAWHDSSPPGPT